MTNLSHVYGLADLPIRRLTEQEVAKLYAALRMAVLGDELHQTTESVHTAEDLLDRHDRISRAFGCFLGRELVGAVRLVIVHCPHDLPSSVFLDRRFAHWQPGSFAEISRLIVRRPYRHLGIGTRLVTRALISAARRGIRNIIVMAAESAKNVDHYASLGLRVLDGGFYAENRVVFFPDPMATFQLCVHRRRHPAIPGFERRGVWLGGNEAEV